ncbi:MAG: hypothetical protein R3A13_09635 [Bdellovibrionota bacterium]
MSIIKPLRNDQRLIEFSTPRIIHNPVHGNSLRNLDGVPFITANDLTENQQAKITTKTACAIALSLSLALKSTQDSFSKAWNRIALYEGVDRRVPATGENTSLFSQRNSPLKRQDN